MDKIFNKKISYKYYLLLGVATGLLFFLNMAVFLMTMIILLCMLLIFSKNRVKLFILILSTGVIAFPQYLYVESGPSIFHIKIHVGYLLNRVDLFSFLNYWWQNIGLNLILIPIGFILSDKTAKKVIISFFTLFMVGNVLQFSPEIAANHKFFNFFVIIGSMYSAFLIIKLFRKNIKYKLLGISLVLLLTLSGIIDFFPIYNDTKINLADYSQNKNILWIKDHTSQKAKFLNTDYLYDTASLAGRRIFLGWPYFAWSQGYDTTSRDNLRKSLLLTNNFSYFCSNISKYKISFAEVNTNSQDAKVNINFFNNNFPKVYTNNSNYSIYNLSRCR